jgi:hypothetical protein
MEFPKRIVAFHKESTEILHMIRQGFWQDAIYETKGACTRAINTAASQGRIKAADYAILPIDEFRKIEKTKVVTNLMSGKEVTISVNAPRSCDPSSEAYWSA